MTIRGYCAATLSNAWPTARRCGTGDAQELMSELRRFGCATVLNGHIPQIIQKVEGNSTFRTASSRADVTLATFAVAAVAREQSRPNVR